MPMVLQTISSLHNRWRFGYLCTLRLPNSCPIQTTTVEGPSKDDICWYSAIQVLFGGQIDRLNFANTLSKSSKECKNLLKNETAKFQDVDERESCSSAGLERLQVLSMMTVKGVLQLDDYMLGIEKRNGHSG